MALNIVAPSQSRLQRCVIDGECYVSPNMSQLPIGNGTAYRVTPCECMSTDSCQLDADPISLNSYVPHLATVLERDIHAVVVESLYDQKRSARDEYGSQR